MLNAITIENIAVAKQVSIDFPEGFSVLTGGTGAGKSIVVDSLGILAGGKAPREMIRGGETKATVSVIFSRLDDFLPLLEEAGFAPDENGELFISRSFTADGKSTVRIGGRAATVAQLREIGDALISINGQGDSHALSDRSLYIGYIDEFASLEDDVAAYRTVYDQMQAENAELARLTDLLKEQKMLVDLYKGYVKELDAAKLQDPDEEEKLTKLRDKIRGIEKISKCSNLVYRALSQNDKGASASYLIEKASGAMSQLSGVLDKADELAARLDEIRFELEDIASEALTVLDGLDVDDPEKQLTAIETRLALISRLEKKYSQPTITDLISFRRETAEKLRVLTDADIEIKEHTAERDRYTDEATKLAAALTEKRLVAAERLRGEMLDTLSYLDMPKVRFFVNIKPVALHTRGSDFIELLISANAGEEPQPLEKIASGGEMARVMLALKCALAGKHGVGCLVFDEIDTGVSGGTSEKIGRKLKMLSENTQIICVTHSPQIASCADTHFLIEKGEKGGRTVSTVRELDREGRVSEIARIIGGVSVTDTQRGAAEDLLKN